MTGARVVAKLVAAVVGCGVAGLPAWQAAAVEVRIPQEEKRPPSGPKTELKDLGGGFLAADLSELVNNDAISSEADRSDADLDEWKQSFPAEDLPEAGKFEPKDVKAPFLFPTKEAGKRNNIACSGQKIPLELKAKELLLLVTATNANQEAKLTIEYADGQAQADLKVTDWCQQAAFGEKAGVVCPDRIAVGVGGDKTLGKEKKECRMWVISVPLAADRELKAITLPENPRIHIFALTVAK